MLYDVIARKGANYPPKIGEYAYYNAKRSWGGSLHSSYQISWEVPPELRVPTFVVKTADGRSRRCHYSMRTDLGAQPHITCHAVITEISSRGPPPPSQPSWSCGPGFCNAAEWYSRAFRHHSELENSRPYAPALLEWRRGEIGSKFRQGDLEQAINDLEQSIKSGASSARATSSRRLTTSSSRLTLKSRK